MHLKGLPEDIVRVLAGETFLMLQALHRVGLCHSKLSLDRLLFSTEGHVLWNDEGIEQMAKPSTEGNAKLTSYHEFEDWNRYGWLLLQLRCGSQAVNKIPDDYDKLIAFLCRLKSQYNISDNLHSLLLTLILGDNNVEKPEDFSTDEAIWILENVQKTRKPDSGSVDVKSINAAALESLVVNLTTKVSQLQDLVITSEIALTEETYIHGQDSSMIGELKSHLSVLRTEQMLCANRLEVGQKMLDRLKMRIKQFEISIRLSVEELIAGHPFFGNMNWERVSAKASACSLFPSIYKDKIKSGRRSGVYRSPTPTQRLHETIDLPHYLPTLISSRHASFTYLVTKNSIDRHT
tara:strand:- start:920 stop:1966 length:1047 start_codon:yes stop_codon:yes gene_type:complete